MIAKSAKWLLLLHVVLLCLLLAGHFHKVYAQSDDEYAEEDLFGSDEDFTESEEGVFGAPEDDFTEGGQFVDESRVAPGQGVTAGGRQAQLRTLTEREQLPMNAAWGAGTGLMIGGWYALINNGTNRQTQRSVGLGIVLGTLIGITIGVRSLIVPNAPIPVSQIPVYWESDSPVAQATSSRPVPFLFSYTLRF